MPIWTGRRARALSYYYETRLHRWERSRQEASIPVCVHTYSFNVYHRDICGCTCIINALAHRTVTVQSLQHHVIVTRGSRACNEQPERLSSAVFFSYLLASRMVRRAMQDIGWVAIQWNWYTR